MNKAHPNESACECCWQGIFQLQAAPQVETMNRNIQQRVAPWFTGRDPAVVFVDEFTVEAFRRSPEVVKAPTAPGWWWSADDGWTGPFDSGQAAWDDGQAFLKTHKERKRAR